MITKKDAIKLGKQIIQPALQAQKENCGNDGLTIRGTVINILDNVWYEVFDNKLKEQFGFNKENFYSESGWM